MAVEEAEVDEVEEASSEEVRGTTEVVTDPTEAEVEEHPTNLSVLVSRLLPPLPPLAHKCGSRKEREGEIYCYAVDRQSKR